jgi:CMP-N,N'-diacetyllegionaminic acid synthase
MAAETVICIIPARGGSQRLPGKNLTALGGKPLLAWTIEAALASNHIERTFVSTNDAEIAAAARNHGAEVIDRPAELSGPTASSESALLHALDHLREAEGLEPDTVVFLQATSPLRAEGEIDAAIETFRREGADSLFSAGRVPGFAWIVDGAGPRPVNYDPLKRPRTQDLTEHVVFENGSIYVFKSDLLRRTGCRLGGKTAVHIQRPEHTFEIDDHEDLLWIRKLKAAATGEQQPE